MPALIGEESWEGDWLERWYDFGKPRPVTVVRDGALALNVNGDESFQSGAIRRQELSDARGITVETQLSVRISRAQWQSIRVMLRGATDLQRVTEADREDGLIGALGVPRQECAVAVPAGEGERCRVDSRRTWATTTCISRSLPGFVKGAGFRCADDSSRRALCRGGGWASGVREPRARGDRRAGAAASAWECCRNGVDGGAGADLAGGGDGARGDGSAEREAGAEGGGDGAGEAGGTPAQGK
ncbi:MAG: hypothetical protein IPJ56_08550 [Gemmatimonadetes bacterium]|nr:hypothetical protein [Gemmatimonadota bacterium]